MSIESSLDAELHKFSVIDFSCIKLVYFCMGLLLFVFYSNLSVLDWWFYGALTLICAMPLWVHFLSSKGSLKERIHIYLKTNTSAKQVLLFLSCFFFALFLAVLLPSIVSFAWWVYAVLLLLFAIKPLTVSRCW